MNIFYNKNGIGDTLIIALTDIENRTYERKGNVAKIFDQDSGTVAGYHIFSISEQLQIDAVVEVEITESLIEKINEIIKQNGFDDQLNADLSPKFVVGYVETKEKHPNADKLSICTVNVGAEQLQIVCGAPNVDAEQKVVVAKV